MIKRPQPMPVREAEFRLAIHQTHDCEAEELEEIVDVRISRNGVKWEGRVHVFTLRGHPSATLCYAWPEAITATATVIRATLHSEKISSAERAVLSVLQRSRQKRTVVGPPSRFPPTG
jgi:hypothetical protein